MTDKQGSNGNNMSFPRKRETNSIFMLRGAPEGHGGLICNAAHGLAIEINLKKEIVWE